MTLKARTLTQEPAAPIKSSVDLILPSLELMSETELVELRHQVDLRLQLNLESLDLAEELALQFRQAKALLHDIQNDKDIATNQKAQIFNSVRAQLSDIIRQQEAVWSMQRLKKYEVAFVKASNLLSDEAKEAFFDLYGEHLKEADAQ